MTYSKISPRLSEQETLDPQRSFRGRVPETEAPQGMSTRFALGTVLAGRYRITGILGRGGMGEVYRADDLELGETVALKCLPEAAECRAQNIDRMLGEVRMARKVSHPNVCRVHDLEMHTDDRMGELRFISMEYIEGEDLASFLRRTGRLPKARAFEVASEICAGLAAMHGKGVLHRDVKPSNVMIDRGGHARLTDFGLAWGGHERSNGGGTPAYMAPEQFTSEISTVRSDIYALGLVLYELFTGTRVFEGRSPVEYGWKHIEQLPEAPSAHWSEIDPWVERALLDCLEKDPKRRPASVGEVIESLRGGRPGSAVAGRQAMGPRGQELGSSPGDSVGSAALVETLVDPQVGEVWGGYPAQDSALRHAKDQLCPCMVTDQQGAHRRRVQGLTLATALMALTALSNLAFVWTLRAGEEELRPQRTTQRVLSSRALGSLVESDLCKWGLNIRNSDFDGPSRTDLTRSEKSGEKSMSE